MTHEEELNKAASYEAFDYVDKIIWEHKDTTTIQRNDHDVEKGYEEGFIAGAEWYKEQMLKEAVEGEYDKYPAAIYLEVPIPRMNQGDKVRFIIVKED